MIIGVGVDCEKISRFAHLRKDLAKRLFTQKEIEYCINSSNTKEKLAARFCAKEAVKKAMTSIGEDIAFTDIEVIKSAKYPQISFKKKGLNMRYKVHLSISHSNDMAMALAVVEQKWKKN